MKKILTLSLAIIISTFNFAQQKKAYISFDKTEHDFGNIVQENGLATVIFEFTNTGAEPVIITSVDKSCGCTTPDFTKEPVAPGSKGFVSAAYNPSGRPGGFSKTLTVHSNAENNLITLTISGIVTEKVKSVEDSYPNIIGDVRFDKLLVNFATIYNNEVKSEIINFINTSSDSIILSISQSQLPAYINVIIEPAKIGKDQTGTLTINYDGSKVDDWDYVKTIFYLSFNGTINSTNKISVTSVVKEKFDDVNTETAPKIEFESTEYNFGTINEGDKVEFEFNYKNTGKSDLIIRKTRTSCGCTTTSTVSEPLKPGKTGTIKTVFDSTGKTGTQNKIITVISNDPTQDKILLKVKGEVNE